MQKNINELQTVSSSGQSVTSAQKQRCLKINLLHSFQKQYIFFKSNWKIPQELENINSARIKKYSNKLFMAQEEFS